jgi:hypothetical protein
VSLKRSCVGFGPNMDMVVSPEKPQTNVARPAAAVRTLGQGGRTKVRLATNFASPVWTKPREPKRKVAPGVSETLRPSI